MISFMPRPHAHSSPPGFFFRWLPAVAWLVSFTLYAGMSSYLAVASTRRVEAGSTSWLAVAALGSVALLSFVITIRASRDARAMAVPPASMASMAAGQAIAPLAADPPAIDPPGTDPSATDQPAIDQPAIDSPVVDSRVIDSRVVDQLAIDPPTIAMLTQGTAQDADFPPTLVMAGDEVRTVAAPAPAPRSEQLPALLPAAQHRSQPQPTDDWPPTESVEQRLAGMLAALEAAGILLPGEVPLYRAIEIAQVTAGLTGQHEVFGLDELLAVLDAVDGDRSVGFEHLALYPTVGAVQRQQIIGFVEDAARLAGRFGALGEVEVVGLGDGPLRSAARDAVEPTEAVVHFALADHWYAVSFTVFADGFPLDLIEGLASAFAPEADGRVFVEAWSEGLVAISCIDPDRLGDLDTALAWDGATFDRVIGTPSGPSTPSLTTGGEPAPDTGRSLTTGLG